MRKLLALLLPAKLFLLFILYPAFAQHANWIYAAERVCSQSCLCTEVSGSIQDVIRVGTAVSADEVPIRYQVQGEGEPALVFVHGWCCDRSYWDAQVDYFARNYKVVAVDLAGHGESGLGREAWTITAFGEDVVAVIEKLDLRKVVLIGHSMGGPVILEAARRIQGRVIGLVGVDTFVAYGQLDTSEFLAPFRADFAGSTDNFVRQFLFTPNSDPTLVDTISTDMSAAPAEVGLSAMEALLAYDWASVMQEVLAPIRCINSDMVPTDVEASRLHAASFDVEVISGVGHFVMLEDPETFNSILAEILGEYISAN